MQFEFTPVRVSGGRKFQGDAFVVGHGESEFSIVVATASCRAAASVAAGGTLTAARLSLRLLKSGILWPSAAGG